MPFPGIGALHPLVGDYTATPGSIAAASTGSVSIAVPGSIPGQAFFIKADSLETNLAIGGARCAVAGTVIVRLINPTAGAIVGAAQVFTVIAL